MDKKKLIAAILGVLLTVAGSIWAFDFKGAVCNADRSPASSEQGK